MLRSNDCRTSIVFFVIVCVAAGCDGPDTTTTREPQPRPVSAIVLKTIDPVRIMSVTGSVDAWKTEDIGFQVAGRVDGILEPGTDVHGMSVDENGDPIDPAPTRIAVLEKTRYQLRHRSAQAQLKTAQAQASAADSELENIVPQQIAAARADQTVAKQEFDRIDRLFKQGAGTQSDLDKATARLDGAQASLDQATANRLVKQAELESMQAKVDEAGEQVAQAQKDLDDTELYSPFRGQIASVHQIPGAYVQAGQSVATIQMMDPVKVEVAVSARTDARLNFNDIVNVYPPDSSEPLAAFVYEKATLADPATRTFNITLLVRNQKIPIGLPDDIDSSLIRTRNLWKLFPESPTDPERRFVDVNAIHQDAEGEFVWMVEGLTVDKLRSTRPSALTVKKVHVKLGDRRLRFFEVAVMRELVDYGELDPDQSVVAGLLQDYQGNPLSQEQAATAFDDGATLYFVREQWQLRPGDLVNVELSGARTDPGFFVPMDTITHAAGKNHVFVVDGDGATSTARRVEVKVTESGETGSLLRIEAVDSSALSDGMRIVANGVHYLVDGEPVAVAEQKELRP